jgi:DNA polymerase-3 subunit delta
MATNKTTAGKDERAGVGGGLPRVLILHGKDRFRQDEKLQEMTAALVKQHGEGGVDTVRFDGQQGARIIADILDECRSFGLMQQHKIVLVDNADLLVKVSEEEEGGAPGGQAARGSRGGAKRAHIPATAREMLENYAAEPSQTATLVLRASTWRPGNLDKAVAKVGQVVKCEPMSEPEAIAWAQRRAKEAHRTSIGPKAAADLVAAVGTELGRIDTELEKLAIAAGGEGAPITVELIADMVGVTKEEEFWSIQEGLMKGRPGETLAELRRLIEVSRHDPVALGWSYMEAARKIHLAAAALAQNVALRSLVKPLRMWGQDADRRLEELGNLARAAGPIRAARLFNYAVQTDGWNKSSMGEPARNLEVLTIRFAQAARLGGSGVGGSGVGGAGGRGR